MQPSPSGAIALLTHSLTNLMQTKKARDAVLKRIVILHALLSAGWNPDGALIESVRLVEKFNLS